MNKKYKCATQECLIELQKLSTKNKNEKIIDRCFINDMSFSFGAGRNN